MSLFVRDDAAIVDDAPGTLTHRLANERFGIVASQRQGGDRSDIDRRTAGSEFLEVAVDAAPVERHACHAQRVLVGDRGRPQRGVAIDE